MTLLVVLVAIGIAIGVAGTLVPILPGIWLVWVSCLVYGIVAGFGALGAGAMGLITVLAVAGTILGLVVPQRSAAQQGVPQRWQVLAAGLAVAGFFLIPVVGAAIGFVAGVALGAWVETRNGRRTVAATIATLRGVAVAAGIQFGAALLMALVWVAWVVAG